MSKAAQVQCTRFNILDLHGCFLHVWCSIITLCNHSESLPSQLLACLVSFCRFASVLPSGVWATRARVGDRHHDHFVWIIASIWAVDLVTPLVPYCHGLAFDFVASAADQNLVQLIDIISAECWVQSCRHLVQAAINGILLYWNWGKNS